MPLARLCSEPAKNKLSKSSPVGSSGVASAYTFSLQRWRSGPPCGAVPARRRRRTSRGAQEDELLGDVATERGPGQSDLLQVGGVVERERVASHGRDALRD